MQLPDELEMSESGRTIQSDWIIGILMMIVSMSCAIAYYLILSIIYKDKELFRMASYRFMFFLGIFDVFQCLPHFVTGIFTIKQSVFHPALAKAMGMIATPCYVTFTLLTIFLSFNRFIQLSSPTLENLFFGGRRWMIWIGIATSFWVLFVLALASPWATIRYIPDWYSWDYDTNLPYSHIVQKIEMCIEIGGIFVSAFFYILIIIRLLNTKKKYLISKNYNAEVKILIQATVITVYCTVLNVLWHNYSWMLPQHLWSYTALNFMWICNSAVHPIIYFIVNKALRHKIGVKRTGTALGPVSVFEHKHKMETRTDHTMVSVKY
ncbi:Serpentine Receptor, class T [Caenorhabditis elegans]|uniref:Serpentine Receptor, class T n=1 Tax=Caenorhabditis elegans TaxID=6239 RepID=Q9TZM1_CAEEL|nr:Serpentine Receptor, class T [Caenorhabditis elegans]CCD71549.1 Serpentine Receptor, class T [Caenorhabditis elegans]|eukprot:NP_492841.3 Serpentine Receptor, class T [Caenorhabditis elegans]